MKKEIIVHPYNLHATDEESKEENKYYFRSHGVYLHGKLDTDNGYDLCGMENFPEKQSPLKGFDCIVAMRNSEKRKAKLFLWEAKEWSMPDRIAWKGLIVQDGDEEAMKYAMRMRRRKESYL